MANLEDMFSGVADDISGLRAQGFSEPEILGWVGDQVKEYQGYGLTREQAFDALQAPKASRPSLGRRFTQSAIRDATFNFLGEQQPAAETTAEALADTAGQLTGFALPGGLALKGAKTALTGAKIASPFLKNAATHALAGTAYEAAKTGSQAIQAPEGEAPGVQEWLANLLTGAGLFAAAGSLPGLAKAAKSGRLPDVGFASGPQIKEQAGRMWRHVKGGQPEPSVLEAITEKLRVEEAAKAESEAASAAAPPPVSADTQLVEQMMEAIRKDLPLVSPERPGFNWAMAEARNSFEPPKMLPERTSPLPMPEEFPGGVANGPKLDFERPSTPVGRPVDSRAEWIESGVKFAQELREKYQRELAPYGREVGGGGSPPVAEAAPPAPPPSILDVQQSIAGLTRQAGEVAQAVRGVRGKQKPGQAFGPLDYEKMEVQLTPQEITKIKANQTALDGAIADQSRLAQDLTFERVKQNMAEHGYEVAHDAKATGPWGDVVTVKERGEVTWRGTREEFLQTASARRGRMFDAPESVGDPVSTAKAEVRLQEKLAAGETPPQKVPGFRVVCW